MKSCNSTKCKKKFTNYNIIGPTRVPYHPSTLATPFILVFFVVVFCFIYLLMPVKFEQNCVVYIINITPDENSPLHLRVLLLLSKVVEVRTKGLGALNVVGHVDLLVGRVSTVITTANGQENNTGLENILEAQGDGNRTTLASVVGVDAPHLLGGSGSSTETPVMGVGHPVVTIVN